MEIILSLAVIVTVIIITIAAFSKANSDDEVAEVSHYSGSVFTTRYSRYRYRARKNIMTNREKDFFVRLNRIFGERCYVLSQIQLSNLLDHTVKGQSFRGAFAHINGKSVDYVLIRKSDLTTLCAIELDDSTHDREHRQIRDAEVNHMFRMAKQPLAHIRYNYAMSDQDIVNIVRDVINSLL
ncbi:MAG: DUF2726 domain-containing protein [Candidatus Saccharibacteria bacterium]|nr:DUF2726 domain-containing protein [Candidatus Saccharibacteria bacterium]